MNALERFIAGLGPGMDIVAGAVGLPVHALADAGCPDKTAQLLHRLAERFYGETSFRGYQRKAVAAAQQRGHSLPTLEVIERYAARAKTQRDGWVMCVELCRTTADTNAMEKLARKKLREFSTPREPEPGVRVYRRKGKPWTMSVTGPAADVADVYASLDDARSFGSFKQAFFGGDAAAAEVRTNVIIHLDELDRVVDGEGEEVTLRMTNGASISGAELVARRLAQHGYATLVHPHEGPVNLYRTSRMANEKQRLMAGAENPVCPWDECSIPADECQVHHLTAWRHGGETNMANLSTCCKYHNGVNDDDPNAPPRRGRLARVEGKVTWLPPWARPAPPPGPREDSA